MDGEEYEVESITRARVYDKRGKKITWRYYVKWKGYDWDESTWEPTESFQGGSEHILEAFWERIDTNGRDISDASAFKKGEELFISGPPGKKSSKRKSNGSKVQPSPSSKDIPDSNAVSISAPLLPPRKRQRMQVTSDEEDDIEELKPKRQARSVIAPPRPNRRVSVGGQKNAGTSARTTKRRRASSPGPRKQPPKRLPSAGDSQLDADGETDPDAVEVEDELMLVSGEDAEEPIASRDPPATTSTRANGLQEIVFDDLEHFYSGNPIDIDQTTDEPAHTQKRAVRSRPQSPPAALPAPDHRTPPPQAPTSPTQPSPDPLFDSPSQFSDGAREIQRESSLPFHRARAANPLVKLIDPTMTEKKGMQSRITAKARLMSIPSTSASGSNQTAKRGGKPGPGRSSSRMTTKNRSSLLTATKGVLKTVKGKFAAINAERDQPDEIEEAPTARETSEELRFPITSWSDEDTMGDVEQAEGPSIPQSSSTPAGNELLILAGLQKDAEILPDYEDEEEPTTQIKAADVLQGSSTSSAQVKDALAEEPSSEVAEVCQAGDQLMESAPSVADPGPQVSNTAADTSVPSVVAPPSEEVVKKNIELAKEQLFPSTHTSFNTFGDMNSSFRSTIFGPLYQGVTVNHSPVAEDELSTTFRLISNDTVLPLVLKDRNQIKVGINDIQIGKSSSGKVALFYGPEDAAAIVNTLKSGGTARVVLDSSAGTAQQEHFTTLLQRFESSHTLIAPVDKEVCVLYSSENSSVAGKLDAPSHLMGLSRTLLISRASIENQLAYVAAVMKATPL